MFVLYRAKPGAYSVVEVGGTSLCRYGVVAQIHDPWRRGETALFVCALLCDCLCTLSLPGCWCQKTVIPPGIQVHSILLGVWVWIQTGCFNLSLNSLVIVLCYCSIVDFVISNSTLFARRKFS